LREKRPITLMKTVSARMIIAPDISVRQTSCEGILAY